LLPFGQNFLWTFGTCLVENCIVFTQIFFFKNHAYSKQVKQIGNHLFRTLEMDSTATDVHRRNS